MYKFRLTRQRMRAQLRYQIKLQDSPNGRFINFDAPGADPIVVCTCPNGVNDLGVIAGSTLDTNDVNHGFLRAPPDGQCVVFDDTQTPAGTGGSQGTNPVAINDLGMIVGTYTDGNNANHGFVRSAFGKITTFDAPGASQGTFPGNINYDATTDVEFGFLR